MGRNGFGAMRAFDINEAQWPTILPTIKSDETNAGRGPCTILENEFVKPGKGRV